MLDASHPSGWSGLNIDILDRMATKLGFSYEVRDMGYTDDAHPQWTDVLHREIRNADLTMSYWSVIPERCAKSASNLVALCRTYLIITRRPAATNQRRPG